MSDQDAHLKRAQAAFDGSLDRIVADYGLAPAEEARMLSARTVAAVDRILVLSRDGVPQPQPGVSPTTETVCKCNGCVEVMQMRDVLNTNGYCPGCYTANCSLFVVDGAQCCLRKQRAAEQASLAAQRGASG